MPDAADAALAIDESSGIDIAIIGMAGRFPGAADIDALWRSLMANAEAVTRFESDQPDSAEAGSAHFVPAGFVLSDIESFDAAFFAMSPREAEITDPQHRLLLECAFEALEHAGYAGDLRGMEAGVYVGCGPNGYLLNNIYANRRALDSITPLQLLVGNEKDYLASRISYKLDLKGPSVVVQSACSTSLLAVHVAARALFGGECDLALAGGVSIECPQGKGYRFEPGGIYSPDGHCRPFGAQSGGTVRGNGAGIVVLKRLAEAIADRDTIYAVLRGSATNNDGAAKVGYAAPSIEGQSRVIRAAHAVGEIAPDTIGYIEAHGTATALGDPIEIAALTDAFGPVGSRAQSCAIGSIKSNIGHLDAAAGIAGMIKATLALHRGHIPATLYSAETNPAIDFAGGPFAVASKGREWPRSDRPRRAGVSAFGIGGANVHVVLEEVPLLQREPPRSGHQAILRLSALSPDTLERTASRLARCLREGPQTRLGDVAFTLRAGRKPLSHRMAVAAEDAAEAARLLESGGPAEVARGTVGPTPPSVALMFPGQGTQFLGMGGGLYGHELVFTEALARSDEILRPLLGIGLIEALYPSNGADWTAAAARLSETSLTQPALFAVEHAIARQWMAWGLRPSAMIGHSIGEYVAACLAGVMTLEDALHLVSARGRLMQDLPRGSMLAVSADEDALAPWLGGSVCLAAVNRPGVCVVSGPTPDVADLRAALEAVGVGCQPIATSHAFHSSMMRPCLPSFARIVAGVRLRPPSIPFLSNLTGTWITAAQAVDADYWASHLSGAVRFAEGLGALIAGGGWALVECGPGRSLSAAAREVTRGRGDVIAVPALAPESSDLSDRQHAARARAQLWCHGVNVEPEGEFAGAARIPLPTYPFDRTRHWIEPVDGSEMAGGVPTANERASEETAAGEVAKAIASGHTLHERLARLWSDALGFEQIGPDDDFFALGGDSILGMQIAHRARGLGLPVRPRMILEHPTVRRLAEALAAEAPAAPAEDDQRAFAAAFVPKPEEGCEPFPLTDIQHAYWIGRGAVIGSGQVAAHSYEEFECTDLDLARLESALRGLIRRHPMLRAVITRDGLQRVLPSVPDYVVHTTDLSHLDPQAAERRLAKIRHAKSHLVLPVDAWPLFDVSATSMPGGTTRLHVSFDLLIADAWSIMLFWRELERRYLDPTYAPAPVPVTFRDYVLAERRLQVGPSFRCARDYWLERAHDFPDAPGLQLACEPESIAQPRFVRRSARIDADAWSRLKALGTRQGLTPSVLLCAAYAEVLAAWSETPRFCLNLPAFNRLPVHPDISEVIGDFTSVLLFEVDASADEPFLARAQALQRRLWDDIAALQFTGVKLLRSIAAHRPTLPVMPYVFTSLIFPGMPDAPVGGKIGRLVEGVSQTPQVWLDCQVYEENGALLFNWDSVEALFDPAMLDCMFDEFQRMLAQLADNEEVWTRVDWREARAARFVGRARRLANATALESPQTVLHGPFLDRAAADPDALAVIAARTLTYRDLAQASAALAADLHRAGMIGGARVAVVADKGWEQVVAVMGVVRAGCAYVPLDPALPSMRLHALLSLSSAAAIVTVPDLDRSLDWPPDVPRIVIDETTLEREVAWTEPKIDPDAVAYVIFTSGTTGAPKGVVITHRGAANTIADINRRFAVTAADRALALSALSFDLSVYDVFGLLAAGGAVVTPDARAPHDPAHWLKRLREARVTIWNSVPALMELLASQVELSVAEPPLTLRLVMLSGDWIPIGLPDRVRAFAPRADLASLGGATEASIWSIFHVIGAVEPSWRSIPYGKPLANQTFHVLDRHLRPRPDGVAGHLYIGGTGLAVGYLDSPTETASRFIIHPVTAERLYRTGDLGRWLPDGSIEFLGRTDSQVKINGFRIETSEIEKVACAHPAVRACATIVAGEDRRSRRLVSYVCARPGVAIDLDALRSHLAQRLPGYMVPMTLVELPALPLSENGKVDRARLPSPPTNPGARVAAGTPTEVRLADLWREMLSLEDVGVTDDFFACGGDSLQATELVTRVRAEFVADFPLRAAFEAPTIRALARAIDAAVAVRSPGDRLGPTAKAVRGSASPLASAQMRLWFHDRLAPGSSTYNIVEPFHLSGPLDADALMAALTIFVQRHDALQTTFHDAGDGPVQIVDGQAHADLRIEELAFPDGEAVNSIARAIDVEARTPFDLARGPLFRARLLRLSADDHALIVAVHHIVWDGWSTAIMIRELGALYRALVSGREPVLPEPELRFADIAIWEQEQLRSGAYDAQLAYWTRQLGGALPALALPTDRASRPADVAEGAREAFFLDAATALRFKDLCHRHGATLFMGYLAAWQTLLHWWCDQDDIVVGAPSGSREHRQSAGVVGFLVNSLAVRTRFGDGLDFGDLLRQVRDAAVAAYANQDAPFDRIVEALQPRRHGLDSAPIFRAWFVLHHVPMPAWDLPGVSVEPSDARFLLAVHDIKLSLIEKDGGVEGGIDYRTALFEPASIAVLRRCFAALVETVGAAPGIALSELARTLDETWDHARRPAKSNHDTKTAWDFTKARRVTIRNEADGR